MKRYLLKALCATGVLLMSASCLNLDPQDKLADGNAWNKAGNFTIFANQFYGWTRDFTGGGYIGGFSGGSHSDIQSDLLDDVNPNEISQGNNTAGPTDGHYNDCYQRIYYTNILLDRAVGFGNQDAIAEPKGEAHFFRAYLYFELVQRFGDVVLVQRPLDLDSEELFLPRNDRTEVVDAIIADLKAAAGLLPETPREDGRVCSYTAWAMISRVALYEGTWQKFHKNNTAKATEYLTEAAAAAKMVMDSQKYQLFYSADLDIQSYRYMFILENVKCNPANLTKKDNKEYIFARRHDEVLKQINTNITHGLISSADAQKVTRKMANMYRCQDGLPVFAYQEGVTVSPRFQGYATMTSEFDNRDNRMSTTLRKSGQVYFDNDTNPRTNWDNTDVGGTTGVAMGSGYQPWKWATERALVDGEEAYDYPIIRYAEVLLNYAEAKYEIGETISDDDLDISLNLVRARINPTMTKLSNALVTGNGLSMREEIRAERTVELFNEGFRLDDLKRWKTAVAEMNMDILGVKCTGTAFADFGSGKNLNADGCLILRTDRNWEDKNYLFPIPTNETKLNPDLGQNPGWGE